MRNKIFRLRSRREGFTLIELLVVIAIIGLLATIAIVALNSARQSSRDAKRIADIRQVQTGLELYFNANSVYPNCSSVTRISAVDSCTASGDIATYLTGIDNITDPSGGTTACGQGDTGGCDYSYVSVSTTDYDIYFFLEGTSGSLGAGAHTADPSGMI